MARILNSDEQKMVDGLVANVTEVLGNDEVDYAVYQGFIEALKPLKEMAKSNKIKAEKEEKESKKALSEALAEDIRKKIKVGDTVSYLLKSKGVIYKDVAIEKITEKRLHVTIDENTKIEIGDKGTNAGSIDLKLGKKYIAFEALVSINGLTVEDFLKD